MGSKILPTSLPRSFHKFFWDVRPETVNPSTHPYYVINRLLDKGNLEAARWVLKTFSKEAVAKSLKDGPVVDPPTAAFFSNFLHISRKSISTKTHYKRIPDLDLWPHGNLN